METFTQEEEKMMLSIFEPDTLLPAQYLETLKRKSHLEGEKQLMLAVLEDGIACFQKCALSPDQKGRLEFSDAEWWIFYNSDEGWLFSFENICDALGLDPWYIRKGLSRWKEAKKAGKTSRPIDRRYKSGGGRRRMR